MRSLSKALAFALLAAGALVTMNSPAQVVPAIKGGGSQINVYGLYDLVKSDENATYDYPPSSHPAASIDDANGWIQGGSIGADFRLGRFAFGQPALGARVTFSNGTLANENTYMFGPELHYSVSRFRPYGDFLIGKGDIDYNKSGGFTDDSIVYEFGGGVDYHFNRRLSIRMVDFQYQFWNLGTHNYPAGLLPGQPAVSIDTTLKPYSLGFGVTFRVR